MSKMTFFFFTHILFWVPSPHFKISISDVCLSFVATVIPIMSFSSFYESNHFDQLLNITFGRLLFSIACHSASHSLFFIYLIENFVKNWTLRIFCFLFVWQFTFPELLDGGLVLVASLMS